jgi:hypothetical protein
MRRLLATGGTLLATAALIAVPAGQASAHPDHFHFVQIGGVMDIHDDETWPWSDEHARVFPRGSAAVGPDMRVNHIHEEGCAGDEVRTTVDATIEDSTDGNVVVTIDYRLYEGTHCGTTDLEAAKTEVHVVGPDQVLNLEPVHLKSTGTGGGDWTTVDLTISNDTTV